MNMDAAKIEAAVTPSTSATNPAAQPDEEVQHSATEDERLFVSVIIPSYNYEDFLAAAIDSALGLDWPDVEVVVVDDGSSDNSRAIIEAYGNRLAAIVYQRNAGHAAACNAGFARSRGNVVIFLDADDVLHSSLVRELAKVWHSGISKVQFQMRTIDADGRPFGGVFPQYHVVPSPAQVRRWASTTYTYPAPPGSGNAYSREFLNKLFPLDGSCGTAGDTYCIVAAPYFGQVLTIPKPLVSYRIHGRNQSALSRLDSPRFGMEVARALQGFAFAQRVAATVGVEVPAQAVNRSLILLPYRLASLRLAREHHPIAADSMASVLGDVTRAAFMPQGMALQARVVIWAWAWLVALTPLFIAQRLILWRFAAVRRPDLLRSVLIRFRVVR